MKHKENSEILYKLNGSPVKLKGTKNINLKRILTRLTAKPVLVTSSDYIVDSVYMICAFLVLVPTLAVVLLIGTDLAQSMYGVIPVKLSTVAIGCIIIETILWLVRNYILNWDMD